MRILEPNYDPYPGLPPSGALTPPTPSAVGAPVYNGVGSDSGLPGATDNPDNWIDGLIGPAYELYPLPTPSTATTGGTSSPTGGGSPATAPAPLAVVGPAGGAPSAVTVVPPSTKTAAPLPVTLTLQRAYCFNPAFHGERGEKKAPDEHVTHEAQLVSFTVPAGCNAVDLWFGPIEPAPGARPHDFQHVIQTGKGRVVDADAGGELDELHLSPGQHVAVIVPWRVGSTAKIEAGRLRMAVVAHFYAADIGSAPSGV